MNNPYQLVLQYTHPSSPDPAHSLSCRSSLLLLSAYPLLQPLHLYLQCPTILEQPLLLFTSLFFAPLKHSSRQSVPAHHPLRPGHSLLPPALSLFFCLSSFHNGNSLSFLSIAHFSSALSMSLIGTAGRLAGRTDQDRAGLCIPWRRECKEPHATPPHLTSSLWQNWCMGFSKAELHSQALQGSLGQKQLGMLLLPARGPGRTSCPLVCDVGRRPKSA